MNDEHTGWAGAIRPATADDVGQIREFILALAEYEKLSHEAKATEADLHTALFGPRPHAEVLIAELEGRPVGFALFFHTFSTFVGKPGLYLEDVFVYPEFRGRGAGLALMRRLAAIAMERGCGRFEWAVLDWNAPSIAFYQSLGARPMDEWTVYRLDGAALEALAE